MKAAGRCWNAELLSVSLAEAKAVIVCGFPYYTGEYPGPEPVPVRHCSGLPQGCWETDGASLYPAAGGISKGVPMVRGQFSHSGGGRRLPGRIGRPGEKRAADPSRVWLLAVSGSHRYRFGYGDPGNGNTFLCGLRSLPKSLSFRMYRRSQGPDPDHCLSAITQKKGELTPEEILLIRKGGLLWGCDRCQEVCPYNREPVMTPIAAFRREIRPILRPGGNDQRNPFRACGFRGPKPLLRNAEILEQSSDC